jgi:hypothetical protein
MKRRRNVSGWNVVVIAAVLLGAFATDACSSSNSSNGGYTCPAVGSKNCPNDQPVTQQDFDTCNRCNAQHAAFVSCAGQSAKATAVPMG